MRRTVVLAWVLAASASLGGCSNADKTSALYDTPKPLDKMSNEEWCAYYANFLTNPSLSAEARAADLKRMRARGCPVAG